MFLFVWVDALHVYVHGQQLGNRSHKSFDFLLDPIV